MGFQARTNYNNNMISLSAFVYSNRSECMQSITIEVSCDDTVWKELP